MTRSNRTSSGVLAVLSGNIGYYYSVLDDKAFAFSHLMRGKSATSSSKGEYLWLSGLSRWVPWVASRAVTELIKMENVRWLGQCRISVADVLYYYW